MKRCWSVLEYCTGMGGDMECRDFVLFLNIVHRHGGRQGMKKFWSDLEYCTFGLIMQYENQLLSSRYYIYIYI